MAVEGEGLENFTTTAEALSVCNAPDVRELFAVKGC